jgi:hypothetical protein
MTGGDFSWRVKRVFPTATLALTGSAPEDAPQSPSWGQATHNIKKQSLLRMSKGHSRWFYI